MFSGELAWTVSCCLCWKCDSSVCFYVCVSVLCVLLIFIFHFGKVGFYVKALLGPDLKRILGGNSNRCHFIPFTFYRLK